MEFSSPSLARSHLPHRSFLLRILLSRFPPTTASIHYETPCGVHPPTGPLVIPNLKSSPAATASSLPVPCPANSKKTPLFSQLGLGCRFSDSDPSSALPPCLILTPSIHFFLSLSLSLACSRMRRVSNASSPPGHPTHDILAVTLLTSHIRVSPTTFNYPSPLKAALGMGILVYAARSACARAGALTYLR